MVGYQYVRHEQESISKSKALCKKAQLFPDQGHDQRESRTHRHLNGEQSHLELTVPLNGCRGNKLLRMERSHTCHSGYATCNLESDR